MVHYHAIVKGRVQGVGFRYFVQGEAVNRGIKGWVRNTDEGHVELKVEGEQQEVFDFLETVRKGSPFSKVNIWTWSHSPSSPIIKTFGLEDS
ncbi:acylphosphatase [Bacillus altitudinis]|uniref:acylphosphatase n=1 Tax=Bacillus altitudinis TaxID=293387 RepID=UPI003981AA63